MGIVGLLWAVCGYSLVFSGSGALIGDFKYFMLGGVGQTPNPEWTARLESMSAKFRELTQKAGAAGTPPAAKPVPVLPAAGV